MTETRPAPMPDPIAHLVAINCHPFHAANAIHAAIESVDAAARAFRATYPADRLEVRLYWHNPEQIPAALSAAAKALDVQVNSRPHHSNGTNLNAQIAEAARDGFDLFFRVDGDDTVARERLVLQSERLRRGHCDLCGGGLQYQPAGAAPFDVIPNHAPSPRDFLENRFVLHPTMAFRIDRFREAGLTYWVRRLEDKALILDAIRAGLRIRNVPKVLGTYRLDRSTRNSFAPKALGFRLNIALSRHRRSAFLGLYAIGLFAAHLVLGGHRLRKLRGFSGGRVPRVASHRSARTQSRTK